jgi:hypothetical protein
VNIAHRPIDRIQRALLNARQHIEECPDDPKAMIEGAQELMAACGNDVHATLGVALRALTLAEGRAAEALAAFKALKAQIEERPRLAWVLSPVFKFGLNGEARSMLYTARVGHDTAGVECTTLPEGNGHATLVVPPPLSLCYVDASGGIYLGEAGVPPALLAEEHTVVSVNEDSPWPGIDEIVVVEDGQERRRVLFAPAGFARQIAAKLAAGDHVMVRSEGGVVRRLVKDGGAVAQPDWLEFLGPDGPALADLVFPDRLRRDWDRDLRRMIAGRTFWVGLIGPTGTGKTEAVERCAREAGRRTGKRVALIRISIATVGSIYHSGTEQNLRRAFRQATQLAKEGCIVVMLVDEVDAMLGDSLGRHEGSVDRRVRLAFQDLSGLVKSGVAVYATMNARTDSWLPSAIARRFTWRSYPRPTRGQIAKVAALYADPEALRCLGLDTEEFGGRIADFLYSDRFIVAKVHFHSGHTQDIRARDLHVCSPGKIKSIVTDFCGDVGDEVDPVTLETLWERMDHEFRAADLNSANVFEVTFLKRMPHEQVNQVELVRPGESASPRAQPSAFARV